MARSPRTGKRDNWLILIGAAKCLKGIALLLLGIGGLKLLHHDSASAATHWISIIHVDPHNHYLAKLIQKIGALQGHKKLLLTLGTFVYSGLFLTEGIGLLLQQHWAEYFTVAVTGSFLPLEIYELTKHFNAAKVVIIVINAVIVAYLVWKLKRGQATRRVGPSSPS